VTLTNRSQSERGVSEIFGTLLLLLIALSVISVIFIYVLSDDGPEEHTFVKISGRTEGPKIILEHQSGETVDPDTKISINLAGTTYTGTVHDWLNDTNGDGVWNLGEQLVFPFEYNLSRLGDYAEIDVQAVDTEENAIVFQGPVETYIFSDLGLEVTVDNTSPKQNDFITIELTATSYGGDVNGSGNVVVSCPLPDGLVFIDSITSQGSYDRDTGEWDIGNVIVGTPATLKIQVQVTGVPYHEFTQFGLILEGSSYTSGSVSVWQNTYLDGFRFAMNDEDIFPHDGSVELTIVTCGGSSPPQAELLLEPTIINESNYHTIAQDLPSTSYPGGYAPLSSAIRLATDRIYDSDYFDPDIRQIFLIVTSGTPDCYWDDTIADGYGAVYSTDDLLVQEDIIAAAEYLNNTINFDNETDQLNAVTVAKTVDLRESTFLNDSIVMPTPGHIYDVLNPIADPGWVFEVEPGKEDFQDSIDIVIKTLLNSINLRVNLQGSTTIDTNVKNNNVIITLNPQ
jgi:flagellin-like protein